MTVELDIGAGRDVRDTVYLDRVSALHVTIFADISIGQTGLAPARFYTAMPNVLELAGLILALTFASWAFRNHRNCRDFGAILVFGLFSLCVDLILLWLGRKNSSKHALSGLGVTPR